MIFRLSCFRKNFCRLRLQLHDLINNPIGLRDLVYFWRERNQFDYMLLVPLEREARSAKLFCDAVEFRSGDDRLVDLDALRMLTDRALTRHSLLESP